MVAPDSFKGSHTAPEVATELAAGFREASQEADLCPLADGGEGTTSVLLAALGGELVPALVHDPLGRVVEARFALLADGRTAVIETAAASGLELVAAADRDPEVATSGGTGELIVGALRAGADRIMLGVGGSATSDGGAGAIAAIEAAGGLGDAELEVLCDTRAAFEDAAIVFGPQKGANGAAVSRLTARLASQARAFPRDPTGVPMTAAAGGLAGGLWATYGARLRSGADAVLDAIGFDERAAATGRVVTGEGRLDSQSLEGKLVSVVAARAAAVGAETHAVVGRLGLEPARARAAGLASVTEAGDPSAFRSAARVLAASSG